MKTKRTGLIGLGDMGMGMARNLLAAGFPLTGLDLRAERMTMLQDAGGMAPPTRRKSAAPRTRSSSW